MTVGFHPRGGGTILFGKKALSHTRERKIEKKNNVRITWGKNRKKTVKEKFYKRKSKRLGGRAMKRENRGGRTTRKKHCSTQPRRAEKVIGKSVEETRQQAKTPGAAHGRRGRNNFPEKRSGGS